MKLIFLLVLYHLVDCQEHPLLFSHPCADNTDITISFKGYLPAEELNQYDVKINKKFSSLPRVKFQFNENALVTWKENKHVRVGDEKLFDSISFTVKGVAPGIIPYFKSVKVNNEEFCDKPFTGFLDKYITSGFGRTKSVCGQKKVLNTGLIVNGESTKEGDWPWHVALLEPVSTDRNGFKYICGGTLISETYVLTAAHCVTSLGVPIVPELLNVVLGKYNLIGADVAAQERKVHKIIVHENFSLRNFDNDISLLKLRSVVVFDDYIQPACLWTPEIDEKMTALSVYGTVVGWGFGANDTLSNHLLKANLRILPDITCKRREPGYYNKQLNSYKFCAGSDNGTVSPCNGDSGGGFTVFVPNPNPESSIDSGAWYVRGIISNTLARFDAKICDPTAYPIFTDVGKYQNWVEKYLYEE